MLATVDSRRDSLLRRDFCASSSCSASVSCSSSKRADPASVLRRFFRFVVQLAIFCAAFFLFGAGSGGNCGTTLYNREGVLRIFAPRRAVFTCAVTDHAKNVRLASCVARQALTSSQTAWCAWVTDNFTAAPCAHPPSVVPTNAAASRLVWPPTRRACGTSVCGRRADRFPPS